MQQRTMFAVDLRLEIFTRKIGIYAPILIISISCPQKVLWQKKEKEKEKKRERKALEWF